MIYAWKIEKIKGLMMIKIKKSGANQWSERGERKGGTSRFLHLHQPFHLLYFLGINHEATLPFFCPSSSSPITYHSTTRFEDPKKWLLSFCGDRLLKWHPKTPNCLKIATIADLQDFEELEIRYDWKMCISRWVGEARNEKIF